MATVPSLALIPSAYKASKLYSVIPANGDGDFSFVRNSSGTRVNSNGLIETVGVNVPRLDYSDGNCPSLLLEPQRSNVLPYSEDFSQWGLDGGTQSVTPNYAVSPDGTQNAYRLQLDKTGVSYSRMYLDAGTIGEKTSSIWIKSNNNSTQNVGLRYDGVGVNLEITSVWKRFELTATSITVSRFQVILFDSIAGNDESCDIQIYGAQLEVGSYATSYIPTNGSIATRIVESCLQGGFQDKNIFGINQGSAVFELKWNEAGYVFDFNDSSGLRIRIFESTSTWTIRDFGGAAWVDTGFTKYDNVKTKIGFKWNGTEFSTFQNGVKSSIVGTFASNMAIESISTNKLNNTSNMQFYNTALTDAELIALTSL